MTNLYKTLLMLIFFAPVYGQWSPQSSGVSVNLNDVACISPTEVVIVGDGGTILKTVDGGEHWIPRTSGTSARISKVQFVSAQTGYAVGSAGTLLKTDDAGETWSSIATGFTSDFYGISCLSENTFFILTGTGIIGTNDGSSFTSVNTPGSNDVEHIQFTDEMHGYASCYENVYRTMDGGVTWSVLAEGFVNNAVSFLNASVGFVYAHGTIYKTTDGGATLNAVGYTNGEVINDVYVMNENRTWEVNALLLLCFCDPVYCIAKRDVLSESESTEIHNCNISGQALQLNAIDFANETIGYVVGDVGQIYKNTTGTMTEMAVDGFTADQVVSITPNPASTEITLTLEKHTGPYSVKITDTSGKQIFEGNYHDSQAVRLGTAGFSEGLYFVTVRTSDQIISKKLLVQH